MRWEKKGTGEYACGELRIHSCVNGPYSGSWVLFTGDEYGIKGDFKSYKRGTFEECKEAAEKISKS